VRGRALVASTVLAAFAVVLGVPAMAVAYEETTERAAAREAGHVAGQEPPEHSSERAAAEHGAAEHGAGAAEHGGGHGEAHLDGGKLAAQIVNFALLIGVLVYFGGRAVSKALAARHQQLKADLAAASELRAAAEAQLKKQESRLSSLEQEIANIRAGVAKEAEAEKARLIEMAEERARRIQDETKFLIDQQVKEAEVQLRREAAQAAVEMAEQIVRRSLQPSDQDRMVERFVADVSKPAPPSGSRV
jgi:F-type H+-transporting ATPase subunit b